MSVKEHRTMTANAAQGSYASVNGIDLYYEITARVSR